MRPRVNHRRGLESFMNGVLVQGQGNRRSGHPGGRRQLAGVVSLLTIDLPQGGFEVEAVERFGHRGRGVTRRHAAGAPAQHGPQLDQPDKLSQTGPTGMLSKLAHRRPRGLHHLLVQQPFLKSEAVGALLPVQRFIAEELVESRAGSVRTVIVKGGGARSPVVAHRKSAEPVQRTIERDGGLRERTRGGPLQPSRKQLVVGRRLIRLARPQWLRIES